MSQLELLGEKILQEDVNQKLLKSLSPKWNTHAVVWRNKSDLDTMSMDDLYNNLKVFKPKVKGVSSLRTNTQNMAFVSSSLNNNTNSSNEAVNTAFVVTTAGTQVNAANLTNIDNLSDAVICAFLASQPRSSILMGIRLLPLIKPRWNVTIAIRGATLQENIEHQEHKTTGTGRVQEGMCLLKLLTPQLWCLVMDLEVMNIVIKLKKDLTMHLWHTLFQVLILRELRKKLETVQKKKDGIQLTVEKLENASESLIFLIDSQIMDNCKKGLGYNTVPPPHTGLFMPSKPDLSYIGLEEVTSGPVVKTLNAKISEDVPKVVKNDNGAPIIEDWKSDDEDETVNTAHPKATMNAAKPRSYFSNSAHSVVKRPIQSKTTFKNSFINQRVNTVRNKHVNTARPKAVVNTARPKAILNAVKGNEVYAVKASACWVWKPKTKGNPQQDLQEKGVIDSGCSRHMTGNMSYLTYYEKIDERYVAFGENLVDHKVKVIRCDNGTEFKNRDMNQFYEMKGIMRQYSVARTP
nr:hypothetical protein [Tanacetum cinerariifolium]